MYVEMRISRVMSTYDGHAAIMLMVRGCYINVNKWTIVVYIPIYMFNAKLDWQGLGIVFVVVVVVVNR